MVITKHFLYNFDVANQCAESTKNSFAKTMSNMLSAP